MKTEFIDKRKGASEKHYKTRNKGCEHAISKLATETIQGPALPLEGVNDVHGDNGLPAGVFGIGDGVANDRFQKDLEDVSGFFVD